MLRNEWEFEFTAARLAEAAEEKRAHHASRLEWWKKKREEVMAKIKESGLEVRESLGEAYSNTTRGFSARVVIDNSMQADLDECSLKVREHEGRVKEYDGWKQVLRANPESRLKLHVEDYLFFYGK